ncbi:hypothetical protein KR038_008324 [Drosophila bunnanda]|nr:hypothetical protein KR038_008324 [Drosophila bunnanda]
MESRRAVNLKQEFDSHKAQSKQLETHLLTTINEKDLTIEGLQQSLKELSRDVLRIDNMQAEYQVIQQRYNKLQEEYESLERTSNASEDQCQRLLADNKRLQLEIGTLKERVEEAQRKLIEAPSQDVLPEEFKVKRECPTEKLVGNQEEFQHSLPQQLRQSAQEIDQLREELRAMKASVVSTEQGLNSGNGLDHFDKLSESTHQSDIKRQDENVPAVKLCLESSKQIKGETREANETDGNSFKGLLNQQERLEAGEKMRVLNIISQLENALVENSRQRQKLAEDALLIGQLQNRNEELAKSLKQAEASQEQIVGLRESLRKAKDELKLQQKQKTDEFNSLEQEYLVKFEECKTENREKFRTYTLKLQESKDLYEGQVNTLKEHLLRKEKLLEAAENQKQMDVSRSKEFEKVAANLQNQIRQVKDERNKALDELANLKSSEERFALQEKERRAQVDAVLNDYKELAASSKEQNQELKQKCEQLAINTDHLREEKSILQVKIDEADALHSRTLKKLHKLEMQMDDLNQQKVTEKSDFEEKLETMTAKIGDLESELQSARLKASGLDDLISKHEDLKLSLSEATGVSSTMQEKVDSLQSQLLASEKEISSRDLEMEKLRSDLKHALEAKDTASVELSALTTQLKAVEDKMFSQAGKFEKELADLNSSMNELQLKLKSLQERKDNLEAENEELKVKLRNAHNLRSQLDEEQKLCASLRTQFIELEETKTRLEKQLGNKEAEVKCKLLEMSQEVELGRHNIGELTKECNKLRCDLKTNTNSFQKEKQELDSTISFLSKENHLLEEKMKLNDNRNAELIAKLKAKEAESETWRETSINQKSVAEAANIKCQQYMEQKVELTKEIEKLRTTLKSKETSPLLVERERMNATISSLLEDKRNLEEKQCTLYDRVAKLEGELSAVKAIKIKGFDSSVDSEGPTSSASVKPRTAKILDPTPSVGSGVIKKSSIIECAVRREKRKTAHDENRKHSGWNELRDFGTMTDPEGECRLPSLKFHVHSDS